MQSQDKIQKIAIGYIRVSTDTQAEHGLSLDIQEEKCREASKQDGYSDILIIKDGGMSGTTIEGRSGMKELLKLVKEDKVCAVYFPHSDRMARNLYEHTLIRNAFREHKVKLVYLNGQSSEDNAISIMMDNVLAAVNQYKSDDTKEKTKEATCEKANAGYLPTRAPLGYMNTKNPDSTAPKHAQRIVVPDPIMAPLIKEAFKLYSSGNLNCQEVIDQLHERGLRGYTGKKVSQSVISKVFTNRFYYGELNWGSIKVQGKHEPLIDEALFNKVQLVIKAHIGHRCRRRKHKFLLSGFVVCPIHNRRYVGSISVSKRKAYYYCGKQHDCGRYWEMIDLEEQIALKFKEFQFSEAFIAKITEKVKAIFEGRSKTYEHSRQNLVNMKIAIEARRSTAEKKLIEGVLDDITYQRVTTDLTKQSEGINTELTTLEQTRGTDIDIALEVLRFSKDIYTTYKNASFELKRALLAFFWERFEVTNHQITKAQPTPLFELLLKENMVFVKPTVSKKKLTTDKCPSPYISYFEKLTALLSDTKYMENVSDQLCLLKSMTGFTLLL